MGQPYQFEENATREIAQAITELGRAAASLGGMLAPMFHNVATTISDFNRLWYGERKLFKPSVWHNIERRERRQRYRELVGLQRRR